MGKLKQFHSTEKLQVEYINVIFSHCAVTFIFYSCNESWFGSLFLTQIQGVSSPIATSEAIIHRRYPVSNSEAQHSVWKAGLQSSDFILLITICDFILLITLFVISTLNLEKTLVQSGDYLCSGFNF